MAFQARSQMSKNKFKDKNAAPSQIAKTASPSPFLAYSFITDYMYRSSINHYLIFNSSTDSFQAQFTVF